MFLFYLLLAQPVLISGLTYGESMAYGKQMLETMQNHQQSQFVYSGSATNTADFEAYMKQRGWTVQFWDRNTVYL